MSPLKRCSLRKSTIFYASSCRKCLLKFALFELFWASECCTNVDDAPRDTGHVIIIEPADNMAELANLLKNNHE